MDYLIPLICTGVRIPLIFGERLETALNESTPQLPTFVRGIAHGRRIELETPLDLPDGEVVEVQVRATSGPRRSLEKLLKLSGAFADDPSAEADFALL